MMFKSETIGHWHTENRSEVRDVWKEHSNDSSNVIYVIYFKTRPTTPGIRFCVCTLGPGRSSTRETPVCGTVGVHNNSQLLGIWEQRI